MVYSGVGGGFRVERSNPPAERKSVSALNSHEELQCCASSVEGERAWGTDREVEVRDHL